MLKHMVDNFDIFICPACEGDLELTGEEIQCLKCCYHFSVEDNIPLLFWPNEWANSKKDVTSIVKSFYEETPFPNYDELDNLESLIRKAQRSVFVHLLNEQIPFNARVLEVGCGTGQLSNFLGIAHRTVFGTDMCLNSLKLGQDFKNRNNLERVNFYQMNLFKPIFRQESFSIVICNGVLHHTSDPFGGFQSIARLVKKGGYIIIGLYNKYGRIITDFRRFIFNITNNRLKFLDPHLRKKYRNSLKSFTWFLDQYKNPHESKHTVGEVLKWFDQTDFEFINSIPKLKNFEIFSEKERLFRPNPKGSGFDHLLAQIRILFSGSNEGGFFVMFGKKR